MDINLYVKLLIFRKSENSKIVLCDVCIHKMIQWIEIPGYSIYEASNNGKIRNKKTKCILKACKHDSGYLRISLINDDGIRKTKMVHIFIAITFIPNPLKKETINHKNWKKDDNNVENLEFMTITEQNKHKRKKEIKDNYTNSIRGVWKCNPETGDKLELFASLKEAALSVSKTKDAKSKICAVAMGRMDKNKNGVPTYLRKIAYGFKWEYNIVDIPGEIWKEIDPSIINNIKGYQISTEGRIKNHKGRIGNPYQGTNNYMWLSIHPHQHRAHVLVAKTFLPNFYGKRVINHKDGDKSNCRLWNLEYNTDSENCLHAHKMKLNPTAKPVRQLDMNHNLIAQYDSTVDASNATGIQKFEIYECLGKKKRDSAGGYKWEHI